jgi:WD40 repeat protein
MRYVAGRSLAEWLAEQRAGHELSAHSATQEAARRDRACDWVATLALALHEAHEAGFVHRDVKPANVLIGQHAQPVLLDFGLVHALEPQPGAHLTATGAQLGTPAYMAPEQIRGEKIDRRTDVWALGVVLYECLTLRLPFRSGSREELFREILSSDPPRVSKVMRSLPEDLALVVGSAMAKDPADRYTTALALAEDLRRVLRHERIHARRPPVWLRARRWTQRHPVVTAVVAVLVVTVGVMMLQQSELRRTLRRTKAIALAAESRKTLGEDPTLSLLLAREALATENNVETRSAAVAALARSHCVELHEFDSAPRQAMWFGADPQGIVVRTDSGVVWRRGEGGWRELFTGPCEALQVAAAGELILVRELHTGRYLAWRSPAGSGALPSPVDLGSNAQLRSSKQSSLLLAVTGNSVELVDSVSGARRPLPVSSLIQAAAFGPSRDRVALLKGGRLSLLDVENAPEGTVSIPVDQPVRFRAIAFAADGRLLAGGDDGRLVAIDRDGRETSFSAPQPEPVTWIVAADAAASAVSRDRLGFLCSWDLESHTLRWRMRASPLSAVAISRDGRHVAAALGNHVRVFNQHGDIVMVGNHGSDIGAIWFAADGRRLLTSSSDRTVRVWVLSPPPVPILAGSAGWIREVDWSPDGQTVVTSCADGILRLWPADSGDAPREIALPTRDSDPGRADNGFTSVRFAPDGRTIAAGSTGNIWLFDPGGDLQRRIAAPGRTEIPRFAFSPDGRRLVICVNREPGAIGVHVLATDGRGSPQYAAFEKPMDGLPFTAEYVDGGRAIAVGDDRGCIRVLDASSLALQTAPWQAHRVLLQVGLLADIPGTSRFVSTGFDASVKVWDVHGRPHGELRGHTNAVKGCAVRGVRLATASFDGTVRLWDLVSLECLAVLEGHLAAVFDVRLSPDGRRLVSGSLDCTARIWPTELDRLAELLDSHVVRRFRPEETARFERLLGAGH